MKLDLKKKNANCSHVISRQWVSVSFKLSNLAKAEKSIVVRENDKDVREIDIHLAEVLRLIDPCGTPRTAD